MSYAIIENKKKSFFKNIKAEQILDELKVEVSEFNEKKSKKYSKKVCKILKKYKISNVVLNNELCGNIDFKNILYENNNYIITGKRLYKVLIINILKDICNMMNTIPSKFIISVLTDEYSIENVDLIERLSEEVKGINIITENISRFEKLSMRLLEKNGTMVKVIDKNRCNLNKSKIILNLDFTEEQIRKFQINKDSLIISISEKISNLKKSFNGIIINDIDIYLNKETKDIRTLALCEAYIYNYLRNIKYNEYAFNKSGYKINGYYRDQEKINCEEFEKIGKIFNRNVKNT